MPYCIARSNFIKELRNMVCLVGMVLWYQSTTSHYCLPLGTEEFGVEEVASWLNACKITSRGYRHSENM